MKTATIPPVRVEPALRDALERSLGHGETLASMVESAVRTELARRQHQAEFVSRGLSAITRSEAAGDWVPVDAVLAKLEAKLSAARQQRSTSTQA